MYYNKYGDDMRDIGLILKNTREDLDLTQIDVMRKTGINNKTLSGYENGISEPDLATFAKLIELYGLSADNVLGIKSNKSPTISEPDEREKQLILCFRELSEAQREDILAAIKAIANR